MDRHGHRVPGRHRQHVAKAAADGPRPYAVVVGWSRVCLGVHIPWTSRVEQALAWQWQG